jgi:hypothetical protein
VSNGSVGTLDSRGFWEVHPITRRAGFHRLCPWGNENSPGERQPKLAIRKCHWLCPWVSTSENSFESFFGEEELRGLTQADAMTVQRNAAGVRGVPGIPFSPQEWGPEG